MSQEQDRAFIFARSWRATNIFPGPHSATHRPINQAIVNQFVEDAQEAGLTKEQLERSLGNVRVFLQNAYDDAEPPENP